MEKRREREGERNGEKVSVEQPRNGNGSRETGMTLLDIDGAKSVARSVWET